MPSELFSFDSAMRVFPVVYLLVALFIRPAFFAGNPKWDYFATGVGLMLAALGESIRCLTIGLDDHIVRGGRHGRVYANRLVTEGMFAHTRNPTYVGNLFSPWGSA